MDTCQDYGISYRRGSQTISAVIGVASDTINQLGISEAQKATYINAIPVSYAVTYIFGTAGSAWILASLGPKLLGGLDKVKADCKELESKMGTSEMDEPGFSPALRPVVFRAYKITNKWFGKGKKVSELEKYLSEQEKLLFVERVRQRGVVKEVKPDMLLQPEDEIVLSGRREFVIGEEDWIGSDRCATTGLSGGNSAGYGDTPDFRRRKGIDNPGTEIYARG